jgi:hypothetical protein
MPQAIMLRETGGPEVLRLEDIAVGSPGRRTLTNPPATFALAPGRPR